MDFTTYLLEKHRGHEVDVTPEGTYLIYRKRAQREEQPYLIYQGRKQHLPTSFPVEHVLFLEMIDEDGCADTWDCYISLHDEVYIIQSMVDHDTHELILRRFRFVSKRGKMYERYDGCNIHEVEQAIIHYVTHLPAYRLWAVTGMLQIDNQRSE